MAARDYGLLEIPLGDGACGVFTLRAPGERRSPRLLASCPDLPAGWRGLEALADCKAPLRHDVEGPERGVQALWLDELKSYEWRFIGPAEPSCSLQNSTRKADWLPVDYDGADGTRAWRGTLKFVNSLGTAWLGCGEHKIRFEVVTRKLSYEEEYRAMVESIAEECQQLLLAWDAPTSLSLSADSEKQARTLLEQFLFLRHVMGPDRLDLFLELLQRRPHSRLATERHWVPASAADPRLFIRDPLHHGRDWQRTATGLINGFSPGEVQTERKFDTVDTPPNRFVKHALGYFAGLCAEVRAMPDIAAGQGSAWLEAGQMETALENLLAAPFFDEVGELRRIPLENQTLQKRAGYRDLLEAWLMLDAAAQIDWPGRKDAYDGTNRDVATLYEFWLYFTLVKLLRDTLKMEPVRDPLAKTADGWLPFCCESETGGMAINLKQGATSFSRFSWKGANGEELRVHLFYNRRFGGRTDVHKSGAYSRGFRPDFTLVILPADYTATDWRQAERDGEKDGRIAYLHFDAKYRIEQITDLIGAEESAEDTDNENAEVAAEERAAKATGTLKNADLYKMHTYNEAIRRTAGSYVLFPGDAPMNSTEKGGNRFERYHEVVPGVGAFALKPSTDKDTPPAGLPQLAEFVGELLRHHSSRFTQSYRINDFTHGMLEEAPAVYTTHHSIQETAALPLATAIMGYVQAEKRELFEKGNGKVGPFFYCRATDEDGHPLTLDISAAQGALFVGWGGGHAGPYRTTDWMGRITSCRLVGKHTILRETGVEPTSDTVHYLLFKLEDVSPFAPRDISELVKARNGVGKGGRYRTFQAKFKEVFVLPPPIVEVG
jgi:predicted component of viral defense system (DUF524 family)